MKIEYHKILLLTLFLTFIHVNCIDNPHFYKATHFEGEPHFQKDKLNSFKIWFGGGKTASGYNSCKQKVNILQIYGYENISQLANGVPLEILNNYPSTMINNLWRKKSSNQDFGKIKFEGLFRVLEVDFDYKKNFYNGLFTQIHLPIRRLEIEDISFQNISYDYQVGPEINYHNWIKFMANFKNHMKNYGIKINKFEKTGIGDLSLLVGYANNYENTDYIDFIDYTIKGGLILPTAEKQDLNNPFSLPLGYDGHLAINLYLDASLGLYEWLTIGGSTSFIIFTNKTQFKRIKTSNLQNGLIKLTKARAKVNKGNIYSLSAFLKADHIFRGFSMLLAYRFDLEAKTKLQLCNNIFSNKIANSDAQLQGWYMNTINLVAEYDFSTYENPHRPQIEIFCDFPINGKRIYKTKLFGFGLNVNYCW